MHTTGTACCLLWLGCAAGGQVVPPTLHVPGERPGDWILSRQNSGGITGAVREFILDSSGRAELRYGNPAIRRCGGQLSAAELGGLVSQLRRSSPETWEGSYNRPGDPACCDRSHVRLSWSVRAAGGEVETRSAAWTSGSHGPLPDGLEAALRDLARLERKVAEACRSGGRPKDK
jgi:hypothetical protein